MLLRRALAVVPRIALPPRQCCYLNSTRRFSRAMTVQLHLHDGEAEQQAKRPRLHESSMEAGDGVASSSSHQAASTAMDIANERANTSTDGPMSEEDKQVFETLASDFLPQSTAKVPFRQGLFLAPMVRIGSLPTRLLSLQYGADLVWSPEIVDRAIIGSDRVVSPRTGMVSFLREGKQILTTHPIERDRLIFQLGSSSPEWAYKAIKHVTAHDDVAGVDLNCGCPKPFSTIGGMGAQLLGTPDLLCSILRAMRKAAPPHIAVSCKIRLLPTKEATQALVRQIIRTGTIDALTVHCRTKDMRPREKALTSRFEEVRQVVEEETNGRLPLICNGDAWDAQEAASMMQATGVKAVMIARGAEGNPSCFRQEGVLSVAQVIAPAWLRLALTFDNNYGNTKYCVSSMAFKPSSSIVPNARPLPDRGDWNKQKLSEVRTKLSQSKSVEEMAAAFDIDIEAEKSKSAEEALKELRRTLEVKASSSKQFGEAILAAKLTKATTSPAQGYASDSGNELVETEGREVGVNVV